MGARKGGGEPAARCGGPVAGGSAARRLHSQVQSNACKGDGDLETQRALILGRGGPGNEVLAGVQRQLVLSCPCLLLSKLNDEVLGAIINLGGDKKSAPETELWAGAEGERKNGPPGR